MDPITPSLSARSPPASSSALKLRMSYQARMRMPLLMVTARIGACGNTNRNAGHPNLTSSGTIGSKSWPSAPRPCSHSTAHSGAGPVSCSTVSSRAMESIGALYGQRHRCGHGSLSPSPGGSIPRPEADTGHWHGRRTRMSKNAQPASTAGSGAPARSDRNSLTVGPDGPILLHDVHLVEQLAHFNREKVIERQPHAKGSGAFGVFETTGDVSKYTKASLFHPGARTDLLLRFSTVAGEQGSPDTWRDVRGFSIKFYTAEGNYDLVGNNTPVFFVRDPMKFPHFIRSQKRLPDSGLRAHH